MRRYYDKSKYYNLFKEYLLDEYLNDEEINDEEINDELEEEKIRRLYEIEAIRRLNEIVRCLLIQSALPLALWPFAVAPASLEDARRVGVRPRFNVCPPLPFGPLEPPESPPLCACRAG